MNIRIEAAKSLIKLGRIVQSLAVVIMRPKDLIEFNRRYYGKSAEIQDWSNERRILSGLNDLERSLLQKIGNRGGKLLLLGLGGGREAIALSKLGFEVTGIDFIRQMVDQARQNAADHGVKITGLVQEISALAVPDMEFEMAWLLAGMYSSIPTRKKRVKMLKRIAAALKPGGHFIFGFFWYPQKSNSSAGFFFRKLIAWMTLGYFRYEKGDMLRFNREYIHAFDSVDRLRKEVNEGGFELIEVVKNDEYEFAGAIARKPLQDDFQAQKKD